MASGSSYAQRRPMERINTSGSFSAPGPMSALTPVDGTPVATASLANKQASSSYGLYQQCINLRDRLCRVPDFPETFMHPDAPFGPGPPAETSSSDPNGTAPNDPVSAVCHTLRLGSSLCFLFNALNLNRQLDINPIATRHNLKACKASAMQFVMACNTELSDLYPEGSFFVNELYGTDTTGTAKVINAITALLDRLEQRGLLLEPAVLPAGEQRAVTALDDRGKVVREIVESERKYVQDLEVLQDYQKRLAQENVIPQDTIHSIFLNLNALVDFQRRFLIGIEAHASQPPEQQRFGHLFRSMEDGFSVYEPYCANFSAASDIAMVEIPNLAKLTDALDPNYELPTFLIKPIQRICKYPLLMAQLVKTTEPTAVHYRELLDGHDSIKRVTDKVNETKRQQENELAVKELDARVEDWKGHDIKSFGSLLLEDTFMVIKNDSEREYHVYLFERIILCCKEVGGGGGKKGSKSNSILKRPASKRNTKLQLKGRIFIANVLSAVPNFRTTGPPQYLLQVTWRGDVVDEHFSIKCRTNEVMMQWQKAINKAVEDGAARRSRSNTSSVSSSRRVASPLSAFPNTPGSEMSAYTPSIMSASDYAPSVHSSRAQYFSNGSDYMGNFDEDGEGSIQSDDRTATGRSTPSTRRGPGTQSLPLHPRQPQDANGIGRPRAQTEDSSSQVIHQWRSQTPSNASNGYPAMPTMPRSSTPSSAASVSVRTPTDASGLQSLRSSASSRGLKSKHSLEWGSAGFGRPAGDDERLPSISRNTSQASLPSQPTPVQPQPIPQPPPMNRTRSASSPHAFQGPLPGSVPLAKSSSQQSWNGGAERQPPLPAVPPLNIHARSNGVSHPNGVNGNGSKRFSSSSNSTDRSSGESSSAQSQGQPYTAATSPASQPSSARMYSVGLPVGGGAAAAVKIKLNFGEDTFVIVVLSSTGYEDLTDKVLKKIRRCGDPKRIDESTLKLRYQDEEGDKILLRDDDDVAMAFEWARSSAVNPTQPTLALWAVCV